MKKFNDKKIISLIEISILLVSIISLAYMIGQEFRMVSAADLCVEIKRSSTAPQVIPLPSPYTTVTAYCDANKNTLQDCKRALCPTTTSQGRNQQPQGGDALKKLISSNLPLPAIKWPKAPTIEPVPNPSGTPTTTTTTTSTKVAEETAKKSGSVMSSVKFVGNIVYHAGVALTIYATTRFVLSKLGASPELANSAGLAAGAAYATWKTVGSKAFEKLIGTSISGAWTFGISIGVAILVFALTYKETRYRAVTFTCYPWDAPRGGAHCEKCNDGEFPCTEYQCKSLGQACNLENKGTTEELCVWTSRNDVNPPVIQAWTRPLSTGYTYIPNNAISPPDRGVRIVPQGNNSGCVRPFSNISFGITLDEPAKCKIDTQRKDSFAEMDFFFGGSSTTKYNHSQTMNLPSPEALASENLTLTNNKEFTLYARCEDTNENDNVANFVFNFCVDAGPDTTAPVVVTTSIINGMPIAAGQNTTPLQIYTNEPATCKWSRVDQSYDGMENNMTCRTGVFQMNAQGLYQCGTNLTGLRDAVNNDFYFKCKDQPHLAGTVNESKRNANTQSYKFTLIGTRPLVIASVGPNETIKDATNVIRVTLEAETSAGFNEGEAICSFKSSADTTNDYIEFFNTGAHEHSQDLFLPAGNYTYDIRCMDLGGNSDTESTSFQIETDTQEPSIVRVFRQQSSLRVITNEPASCVYSNNGCNYLFEDGIDMSSTDDRIHSTSWNPDKTFYIKCEDEFGNQPQPDQCSLVASPYSIGSR